MGLSERVSIPVCRLSHGAAFPLPAYATEGSAGIDLQAAIEAPVTLAPGRRVLVPSGIAIALPLGYEGQVRPRSGLAVRHGITVLNSPGTVDSDYRGEIKIALVNLGDEDFVIEPGMRVAQLVVARHSIVEFLEIDDLDATKRGDSGFGSTGTIR